ncbi:MAG TPA: hypothetical protein DEH78_32095, partial [Solibacterales bacterium]|nr:hypothetical protein [Bryobacterales bacterium]
SDDLGKTWEKMTDAAAVGDRPFYYMHLVPDPQDYNRVYKMSTLATFTVDAGKTWSTLGTFGVEGIPFHPDHHALWI